MLTQLRRPRLQMPDENGLEARVGNTPLLRIRNLSAGLSPDVRVFAKAEWFNPAGSIKDRTAVNIIRTAIAEGKLTPGKRLLDSTSGNMGIAYATYGIAMGIPVTLCLPANASPERIIIMRALGAELVLTDASAGSDGAILEARRLAAENPERYWYANQYDNPANWQAHYVGNRPGDPCTDGRLDNAPGGWAWHFRNHDGHRALSARKTAGRQDHGRAA